MDLPIIIVSIVILSQWALIVYLLRRRKSNQTEDLPPDERSLSLLNRAYQKAQNIIGQAELSGVKIRAQNKVETRKMSEEMAAGIANAASKVEQVLYKSADKASLQFQEFLDDLKIKGQQEEEAIIAESRKQVGDYMAKLQTDLSNGLQSDMAEMRKSIDSYKSAKLAAMDANFVAVAERAMEILLNKKISLTDQADLVHEALDKAKQEKLIN